jgi:hypothetical protein
MEVRVLEATLDKLEEARFFLQKLREAAAPGAVHRDVGAFGHYLSAFLSAARSVPWVLGNEEKERYEAWKPTWEAALTPEDRELLRFTNERRLDEAKRKGAGLKVNWKYISIYELPPEHYQTFEGSRATPLTLVTLEGSIPTPPQVGRAVHHFSDGDDEVLAKCEGWLQYLQKLVDTFLKAHA